MTPMNVRVAPSSAESAPSTDSSMQQIEDLNRQLRQRNEQFVSMQHHLDIAEEQLKRLGVESSSSTRARDRDCDAVVEGGGGKVFFER